MRGLRTIGMRDGCCKGAARARLAQSFAAGRSGLAAIEFAIIAPIFVMALVCSADLGLAFYHAMQVEAAAQAGAEYAAIQGFNAGGISSAVANSTTGFSISATPAPSQSCGCPSNSGVTQVACGTTCADGTVAGSYVTVSAASTYATIIPYPALPPTFQLAATAKVRIQ